MSWFGSFETQREAYSDLVYTVYTARRQGDDTGEYAVKVFRLPDRGLEAELAPGAAGRDELERARLESIRVQEKAAVGSNCIAPVLESGNDAQGLWYATRFYPRSINKMMSGKVALPRASLEHLIRSITQGALDFKRSCGRGHGDIRPTNVQIGKTEKLTEAEVVLCDPLPGGSEKSRDYELRDLRAIGLILLQLVRQRVISQEDAALMLPISPGLEWTRAFGSEASDWLAICNRLLDPNLSPDHFSVEALLTRLDELKPKRRARAPLALAGAALVVVGLALGLWVSRPRPEWVEFTSDPGGATLIIDHVQQSGTTPLRVGLRPGSHQIVAELQHLGLSAQSTNCLVRKGEPASIHLKFDYGSVAIRSIPAGCAIFKDAVKVGVTPAGDQSFVLPTVPPGPVQYELRLEHYQTAEVGGVVTNGGQLELAATLQPVSAEPPPKQVETQPNAVSTPSGIHEGILELRAEPTQATIFDENGRELGRASGDTALRLTLPAGPHTFRARADGLDEAQAVLSVQPGAVLRHTFELPGGIVDWSSEPSNATILGDGQSRISPASFVQKSGVPIRYVIRAPGFESQTNEITLQRGEHRHVVARLVSQSILLSLVSDPPGAQFLAQDGTVLQPAAQTQTYRLALGTTNLIARYSRLGSITNLVHLGPEQAGSQLRFQFQYGTLVLSNLPAEWVVYEGDNRIGAPSDGWIYERPGRHRYTLRGATVSQSLAVTIDPGLNTLRLPGPQKSWKNSLGMWFAWVPNLPGGGVWPGQSGPGGWVAISELTQGEYKKMDGTNPSFYQEGGDNCPVENLTWEQATGFCRWLTSADTAERFGWHYTLPSDEQFVTFAADAERIPRVTSEGRMPSMDESFPFQRLTRLPAAANPNSARTHPEEVASTRKSNQYGLYDVIGNVWEWLQDSSGRGHYYAGGSYLNFSAKTLGTRARERGLEKGPNIGLRLILVPAP